MPESKNAPVRPRAGLDHAARARELAVIGLRLIDADGLPGLSMRRLAAEAGMTAMAVYRYFADKQAVLDAVTGLIHEEFLAERATLTAAREPQAAEWLDVLITSVVNVLVRHHRDVTILAQSQVSGSNRAHLNEQALDNFELSLRQLDEAGITGVAAVQLSFLISQGVFMLALACRGEQGDDSSPDAQLRAQWESLRDVPSERYPFVRDAARSFAHDEDSTTLLQRGVSLFTSVLRRGVEPR